jgi:hypothetical protein
MQSPEKFAQWFNQVVPFALRDITSWDVKCLTELGVIGRFGYYGRQDIETVRVVLEYERLRQNRQSREEIRVADGAIHCRRCGVKLAPEPDGKRGRPYEYCVDCETARGRERHRKWRNSQVNAVAVH